VTDIQMEPLKKKILIYFISWLSLMLCGCLMFYVLTERSKHNFYQQGVSVVQGIAGKNLQSLVNFIIQGTFNPPLNITTDNFSENLKFVAVIENNGTGNNNILAHTDPKFVRWPFTLPLKKPKHIDTIDDVVIEKEDSPYNERLISFSAYISANGTNIGRAYLVVYSYPLDESLSRLRWIFASAAILITIMLLIIYLMYSKGISRPVQPDNYPPRKLGPYIVGIKLHEGGMAGIFMAVNEKNGRTVIVKILLPHLAKDNGHVKLFREEAQLAADLQGLPNIIQLEDYYEKDNAIVMEYIRGKDLSEIMDKVKIIPTDQAVFIISQCCIGLHYAHGKGIVHRDIKPSNIMIRFTGEVKIGDFGIAKKMFRSDGTIVEGIKGTLPYIAPEQIKQIREEPVDARADLYSLGIVFYEMLNGEKVRNLDGVGTYTAIQSILEAEITPLKDLKKDVPAELNDIVMKCVEMKREARYQSAEELREALSVLEKKLNLSCNGPYLSAFMEKHFDERQKR
jgi:hypothetical protein